MMVQSPSESTETQCDHLTPLEIAATAFCSALGALPCRPGEDCDCKDAMRAALLALAEADFPVPEHTVPEMEEIDGEARPCDLKVSPWTSIYVFRSMLREIAGESK